MSDLRLELEHGTAYRPGETIRGEAHWRLDEPAEAVEVRLFWYTSGRGDQDVGGVETERLEVPGIEGSREFEFEAPRSPHSFSGRLITLTWALELVVLPGEETERQDLVIAPRGEELRIAAAEALDSSASLEPS